MPSSSVVIAGKGFDIHGQSRSASVALAKPRHASIRLEHLLQAQASIEDESIPVDEYKVEKRSRRDLWVQD